MKDLLARLDEYQVVSTCNKKVVLSNGMEVSYRYKEEFHAEICLVVEISVRLEGGSYRDRAINDLENRMIIKWFNGKIVEGYDKQSIIQRDASDKLAVLIS
tara:strand:- start:92 stop:394 length:303 start_codon:yes stop_codon:yes gene_type:complete